MYWKADLSPSRRFDKGTQIWTAVWLYDDTSLEKRIVSYATVVYGSCVLASALELSDCLVRQGRQELTRLLQR